MQIVPTPGLPQSAPIVAPTVVAVAGPAAPAEPIEPVRRVTANREGERSDLHAGQHFPRGSAATSSRGRLIDLSV